LRCRAGLVRVRARLRLLQGCPEGLRRVNDRGVTVDETAPSEPSPETPEEEKPEFPGFREGEDLGSIPETGGSVEAPEEDAELAEARVDEQVEGDEDPDAPSVADANENPAHTAPADATTDTID